MFDEDEDDDKEDVNFDEDDEGKQRSLYLFYDRICFCMTKCLSSAGIVFP